MNLFPGEKGATGEVDGGLCAFRHTLDSIALSVLLTDLPVVEVDGQSIVRNALGLLFRKYASALERSNFLCKVTEQR